MSESVDYQETDASEIVGEIFRGDLPIRDAVEKLRKRLLDLTARNALLNYRHPKRRCIQITGQPNLNHVFNRLLDEDKIELAWVSEPPPLEFRGGQKPDARIYAERLGIDTSYVFPRLSDPTSSVNRLCGLQVIAYPADLDRLARKVSSEAKTAIEETGSNMLYLILGFLEFFDSDDSSKPLLAPILCVPLSLERAGIDPETRVQRWAIRYNGGDVTDNTTLREKLKQLSFSLPEFYDEDKPEELFIQLEEAIKHRPRWTLKRQLSIGLLSFGKLAIWEDLDPNKHPGLLVHSLTKTIFEGGDSRNHDDSVGEDYRIDELPADQVPPLIFDADSSQHGALIDVFAGRNLVINGPPGTGKSQTITNIIAAALAKGQTVLFVAEKLAALEVVRHRLDQAGLGKFCLELHSHKTQKKKFIDDITDRLTAQFRPPAQFEGNLATLQRLKRELAAHAALMGSKTGNQLDLTIEEVLWACQRRRAETGDLAALANKIELREASEWTIDDIRARQRRLEAMADLWGAVSRGESPHPWIGFAPRHLDPGEDLAIVEMLNPAVRHFAEMAEYVGDFETVLGCGQPSPLSRVLETAGIVSRLPDLAGAIQFDLLPKLFSPTDRTGAKSETLINKTLAVVDRARSLRRRAVESLVEGVTPDSAALLALRDRADLELHPAIIRSSPTELLTRAQELASGLTALKASASEIAVIWKPLSDDTAAEMLAKLEAAADLDLEGAALSELDKIRQTVSSLVGAALNQATLVREIAEFHGLPVPEDLDEISALAQPRSIPGLIDEELIDDEEIASFGRLIASNIVSRAASVHELEDIAQRLEILEKTVRAALDRCRVAAEPLGLWVGNPITPEAELRLILTLAQRAPLSLLRYRHQGLLDHGIRDIIGRTRIAIDHEAALRSSLEIYFHLDALPQEAVLRAALSTFRRGDSILNLLDRDWRKAKSVYRGIARIQKHRSAKDLADGLSQLLAWLEYREAFLRNREIEECFGGLFQGFDTDLEAVEKLYTWCLESHALITTEPRLHGRIDVISMNANLLSTMLARASQLEADIKCLEGCGGALSEILSEESERFNEARCHGWNAGLEYIIETQRSLREATKAFRKRGDPSLSPVRITELMSGRRGLDKIRPQIEELVAGIGAFDEVGGQVFRRLAPGLRKNLVRKFEAISIACENLDDLVTFLLRHVGPSSTAAQAVAFVKARVALEMLTNVVTVDRGPSSSYDTFVSMVSGAIKLLMEIGSSMEPILAANVTVNQGFLAIKLLAEAQQILAELARDHEVARGLPGVLRDFETDDVALRATHKWGKEVASSSLPSELRVLLLSAQGRTVWDRIFPALKQTTASYGAAMLILDNLRRFGEFDAGRMFGKQATASEIHERLMRALSASDRLLELSRWCSNRGDFLRSELGPFLMLLEGMEVPPNEIGRVFDTAVYLSIAKAIWRESPEIKYFRGDTHSRTRADFRDLDRKIIELTGQDFAVKIDAAKRIPSYSRGARVGDNTGMALIEHLRNRPKSRLSIRHIMRKAGTTLQAFKPCFMMGPLSVAQYLEQGILNFDIVIMDEASQLKPEDAIGAIARGSQLVVVGDPKQLPPTSFFDRYGGGDDDEEDEEQASVLQGMESILDVCQHIFAPTRSLRWHYRSRHESLIAYSNHYFYKNLVVFPSPYPSRSHLGVKWRYVQDGVYEQRQNIREAIRVVDAVVWHMKNRFDESLGVVAMNGTQRDLIEELLERRLMQDEDCQKYQEAWEAKGWGFFVKNLENVQGDERDCIIISTTYGKPRGAASVRQNFGPISRPIGWRRLNVLFTRARLRIELFTSMQPEDIIDDIKTPEGTKALRAYLDFARRGVLGIATETARGPDSDFEISVAEVIRNAGYEVRPQLGIAGYFVDMAVRNPDRPGEWLAAIECDGATYHSALSVRDRDRIRQDILESLGWKGRIHRIWSTDWFWDPVSATRKLLGFLADRRSDAAAEAVGPTISFPWEAEEEDPAAGRPTGDDEAVAALVQTDEPDDLFVEVGDRVTYCFVDSPTVKRTAILTEQVNDPSRDLLNENEPLAQVLLGMRQTEESELKLPNRPARRVRVMKVERAHGVG